MSDFSVQFTHPEKILYPGDNIRKIDLAQYYHAVADWMLPYVNNRPLSMVRCPRGIHHEQFFQKHLGKSQSAALFTADLDKGRHEPYIYIKNEQGLLELVQQSALELHVWGTTVDKPEKPDWMIFDLDPDPLVDFKAVVEAAIFVKDQLDDYGLHSFVKTTGGKGLHVTVPLKRVHSWEALYEFSHLFAQYLASKDPATYIATMSKAKRKGKIFIDYLRNHRTATAIAPYSTRARAHCTVATPIGWHELTPTLKPDAFTWETVPKRLATLKEDPWAEFFAIKQKLPKI